MPSVATSPELGALLRSWTSEPGSAPVDPSLVHKHDSTNVLLSRVAALPEQPHHFAAQVRAPLDHPFFFEHPQDHLPGMLLIEAARQFATAVSHFHYCVPRDHGFVLKQMDVVFNHYAELTAPTFMLGETAERIERHGVLAAMRFSGRFIQGDRDLGQMAGHWRMIPGAVYRRMRRI